MDCICFQVSQGIAQIMESIRSQPQRPSEVTDIFLIGFCVNVETNPTVNKTHHLMAFSDFQSREERLSISPCLLVPRASPPDVTNACSLRELGEFQLLPAAASSFFSEERINYCSTPNYSCKHNPGPQAGLKHSLLSTFQLNKLFLLLKTDT